jgi:hypothetical protein
MARWIALTVLIWLVPCGTALGEVRPLFAGSAAPLAVGPAGVSRTASPSLFVGPAAGGFFAPRRARAGLIAPSARDGAVTRLLDLIARAEAGAAGYDAVQHGARIPPPRRPTRMTLGEIYAWIAATPGQPHAIGRYQFIPPTLRRVARIRGLGPGTRFTAEVQDALAEVLLGEAGLDAFRAGDIGRTGFMRNLARIWAGLPLPNGRSYYHGHAGNRATMTWAAFADGMARIWPARL